MGASEPDLSTFSTQDPSFPSIHPPQTSRDCFPPTHTLHHCTSSHPPKFQLSKAVLLPSSGLPQKVLLFHISPFRVPSPPQWKVVGARSTGARGTHVITWCHLRAPSKTPVPVIKRKKGAPLSLSIRNLGKGGNTCRHKTWGKKMVKTKISFFLREKWETSLACCDWCFHTFAITQTYCQHTLLLWMVPNSQSMLS